MTIPLHCPRERIVFEEAIELASPEERTVFLDRACAGDEALRGRVEELLSACGEAGAFLAEEVPEAAGGGVGWSPAGERPGDRIGRYRLVREIGEGGFGVVYEAEQLEPVRRPVALKILKLGMDTRQVIARFGLERQALALMDHPGIARVFDAGATETGRPYFVMELVDGVPVTRFCDDHRLSLASRLALFLEVCAAVQHAHQRGIIHRDLKPSNVLVEWKDGRPAPKVIDFGIAKAASPVGGDTSSALTWEHQVLGTPAYMSPEQACARGGDVDTRTDVYSLGVLLHELLTGRPPFEMAASAGRGLDEMWRVIREEEPPLASRRVERLGPAEREAAAAARDLPAARLARRLRGDLDWIVARTLRKDRGERYESVADLGRDVRRHLDSRPVAAAAPSASYRLGRFARRHRRALALAAAFGVVVLAGIGASTYFAVWAIRSDRGMQGEAAVAGALNRFLTEDVLAQADPDAQPDRDIRLRTVLERAGGLVGERFRDQPLVEAAIRRTLGRAFDNLGESEAALPHFARAFELRFHELGETHRQTLEAMGDLALARSSNREHQVAQTLGRRVVALAERSLGRDDPLTVVELCRLAQIEFAAGDRRRARAAAAEAVARSQEVDGVPVDEQVLALHVYARALGTAGAVEEGERRLRAAVELARTHLGPDHPRTLAVTGWLAAYLYDHRRTLDVAEALTLDALARSRRALGEAHVRSQILRRNLVLLYRYHLDGRLDDALHHQFELLRHAKRPWREADLAGLRELLDQAEPGAVRPLGDLRSDRWLATFRPPSGEWTGIGSSTAAMVPLASSAGEAPVVPGAGPVWVRQAFRLGPLGEGEPVVLVRSSAPFEVVLNGVGLPPSPRAPGAERLQVFFFDEASRLALRQGDNVIGLHSQTVSAGEILDVALIEIPRPRAAAPGSQTAIDSADPPR